MSSRRGRTLPDPLFHCIRFASGDVRYPLPVAGPIDWRLGLAVASIELPTVPTGHIIAASFASTSTPQAFSFRLECAAGRFRTATFGPRARRRERSRGQGVAVPVDYFDTERELRGGVLHLHCLARRPSNYLLSVCIRPRSIAPPSDAPPDSPVRPASCLSQSTAPAAVSRQACSPTATAMALGIEERADYHAFVRSAWHRPTGLCGAWPQNVWAAARRGRLAAVELVSDWPAAIAAMGDGAPVVASIRFGAGQLANAPLPSTAGHLVLLRGIENGRVIVNDPAAAPGEIERRYDAAEFARAWMQHRGAAYVFADP